MDKLGEFITQSLSSPEFGYFLLEFGDYISKGSFSFVFDCYYVSLIQRQELKVAINNKTRTVYRIGFPLNNKEVQWLSVSPEKLDIKCSITNLKIDVYIQKHALNRLYERLDGMQHRIIQLLLFENLLEFKKVRTKRGQLLLQFNYEDKRVGYLTYQYVEGIVVITTFLLITNNDTPEGERLHELLGIEKEDKRYLGIDKLNAFIYSDLKEDERAVEIFTKAGCMGLFELPSSIVNNDKENEAIVDRFINYLELDKQDDRGSTVK